MPVPVPPRPEPPAPEERLVLARVAEVSRQMCEARALVRALRQRPNRESSPPEADPCEVRHAD
jgi:hypothetical protein